MDGELSALLYLLGSLAYNSRMGHLCGANCKRKTGQSCRTCRSSGTVRFVQLDDRGKPIKPTDGQRRHATPHEKGTAVDMYFDGVSYRKTAQNVKQYFGRETTQVSIYRGVRELTAKADSILKPMKVDTGDVWVADEVVVNVGGKNYWLFNVMDSDSRFMLAAYLSPTWTARAAATALARERAQSPPEQIKTDRLPSYRRAMPRAFPTRKVEHVVSKGIRTEINNNLSERLQGTIRDRDKTLRGLKSRETGQAYVDGLVTHYNYFRSHESLKGKRPAEAAGAELPFTSWEDVAALKSG